MGKEKNVKALIKLNLGCGLVAPDDWINIDSSYNARLARYPKLKKFVGKFKILPRELVEIPWPENITIFDIRKDLPYTVNSVNYIYSSHSLEHLSRAEAKKLIRECYRVLIPGGVIRIIVPDIRASVYKYIETIQQWDINSSHELPPLERFLEINEMYESNLINQPFWIRAYKKLYDKNTHKWAYDIQSLTYLLNTVGFKNIGERKYGESLIEDITNLDAPERFESSLCMEATK